MKKTISVLLSVLMVLSLFSCLSVTTFATEVELESVSFEPADTLEAYEYTCGYWDVSYDEETKEQVNVFYYDEAFDYWADGNVITLCYSDGTSVEYVCEELFYYDEYGNELDEDPLYFYDTQDDEPWGVGTHYVEIEYDGVCTQVPVEILPTPVDSVEFIPAEPINILQNTEGETFVAEIGPYEGQEYFHYYCDNFFYVGNEIVVTYKNGEVETFVCDGDDFYDEDDCAFDWDCYTEYDVQEIAPWTELGSYSLPFYYKGCKSEIPVTITENPVATIEYVTDTKATLIENYDGYYDYCDCDECVGNDNEYFYYDIESYWYPEHGDKLIVTYKDGSKYEYTFTYAEDWFYDENGEPMPYNIDIADNQEDSHWSLGTHSFDLVYMGQKCEIPVEIIENPVKSISVYSESSFDIYELTNGTWDYYYNEYGEEEEFYKYDCPIYKEGVSIVVEYTDGSSVSYWYDEAEDWFFAEDGTQLPYDLGISSNQYDEPWEIGEHEFEIDHMGEYCTLSVNIVENPVEGIEFIPAQQLVFEYEVDGWWDESYDYENDEYYDIFIYDTELYSPYTDGSELKIMYTTGEEESFFYSEAEGEFLDADGNAIPFTVDVIFDDAQYIFPWTLESDTNYVVVEFMGAYTVVRAILDDGQRPEAAEITGLYNGDGNIIVEWSHVTNATEYIVYKRIGTGSWKAIARTTDSYYFDEDVKGFQKYSYYIHTTNSSELQSAYVGSKVAQTQYIPPLEKFSVYNTSEGVRFNCAISNYENAFFRQAEGQEDWDYLGTAPGNEKYLCDTAVESGVKYTYAAIRVYGNYESAAVFSNTIIYLATPKMAKVQNVANGVQVRWNEVECAESYNVYRKTATSGWVLLGKATGNSYIDTTAKAGTTYTYTVRAVAENSMSAYESGLSIKRIATPKVTGVSNSNNGLYVKWNKVADATEYRVYRKTLNSGWKYLATTKNTYYTDTSIKDKCGYYYGYTVIAVSDGVYSGYDNTGVMMQRLFAPKLKTAKNVNDGIQFTWGAVSGARSYYVYRKTATTGWVLLGTTTTTTYLDKTAQPGVNYTYTARAAHNKYLSTYESGISVTRLATPKITGVSNSDSGIYVKWGKVTGATEYRVYRKTLNSGWTYIGTTKNTYYTDTAIKNKAGYYYGYTIIAVNGKTYSAYDNNGVMTKRLLTPVLKSAVNADSGVQITWGSVYGAAGYNVYRKAANSGWVLIGKTSGTSYVDETAIQDVVYTYTVRAYYNNYLSNYNTKGITA